MLDKTRAFIYHPQQSALLINLCKSRLSLLTLPKELYTPGCIIYIHYSADIFTTCKHLQTRHTYIFTEWIFLQYGHSHPKVDHEPVH